MQANNCEISLSYLNGILWCTYRLEVLSPFVQFTKIKQHYRTSSTTYEKHTAESCERRLVLTSHDAEFKQLTRRRSEPNLPTRIGSKISYCAVPLRSSNQAM